MSGTLGSRASDRPCRILSIDGGEGRGIIALEVLKRIEQLVAESPSTDCKTLGGYFDYCIGAGSGAVTAAGVALGWSIDEIDARMWGPLEVLKRRKSPTATRAGRWRAILRNCSELQDFSLSEARPQVNKDPMKAVEVEDSVKCHLAVPLVDVDRQAVELLATHRATPVALQTPLHVILEASIAKSGVRNRAVEVRMDRPDEATPLRKRLGRTPRDRADIGVPSATHDPLGRLTNQLSRFESVEGTGFSNPAGAMVQMARERRPSGCGWGDRRLLVVSVGIGRERHPPRHRRTSGGPAKDRAAIAATAASDFAHINLAREAGGDHGVLQRWSHDQWAWAEPSLGDQPNPNFTYIRYDLSLDSTTLYRHRLVHTDSRTAGHLLRPRTLGMNRQIGRALAEDVDAESLGLQPGHSR